jgi:hypothetical protein
VHLTEAGKGFLAAERYFEEGPPAPPADENDDDFGGRMKDKFRMMFRAITATR